MALRSILTPSSHFAEGVSSDTCGRRRKRASCVLLVCALKHRQFFIFHLIEVSPPSGTSDSPRISTGIEGRLHRFSPRSFASSVRIPFGIRHDSISGPQCAALNNYSGNRSSTNIKLSFNNCAFSLTFQLALSSMMSAVMRIVSNNIIFSPVLAETGMMLFSPPQSAS